MIFECGVIGTVAVTAAEIPLEMQRIKSSLLELNIQSMLKEEAFIGKNEEGFRLQHGRAASYCHLDLSQLESPLESLKHSGQKLLRPPSFNIFRNDPHNGTIYIPQGIRGARSHR
ncbi:hypothetical protein JTE90_023613 [Oedothorax gibbosus]|uniref:Uncharacterized protein n=1 Tax=Oedothorax gibbosus TaxID=931172 RepID=A0AAV6U0F7_9ARAC|nr:hypothetical protein JTE90_023613 [Oedothorax gibbosus]